MSEPYIVAAGAFDRAANLRTAIFAFDIIKYALPGWRLKLHGDGPERASLQALALRLGFDDLRIDFLQWTIPLVDLVSNAAFAWNVHRTTGSGFLRLATSLGVPAAAMRNREIEAANLGLELVPMDDHVALASATFETILAGCHRAGAVLRADLVPSLALQYTSDG